MDHLSPPNPGPLHRPGSLLRNVFLARPVSPFIAQPREVPWAQICCFMSVSPRDRRPRMSLVHCCISAAQHRAWHIVGVQLTFTDYYISCTHSDQCTANLSVYVGIATVRLTWFVYLCVQVIVEELSWGPQGHRGDPPHILISSKHPNARFTGLALRLLGHLWAFSEPLCE